jgi:hypothetical protein
MAATITTNGNGGDLGYQTGYFSGPVGQPVDQTFFNNAFAGHINTNKIYKEVYNCNIIGDCTMSTWLEEFGGVEYDCHPAYTNLEYNGYRRQIKAAAGSTIPSWPATGTITLSSKDHFVSGQFVLPQVGQTIVLTPSGMLANITAVTHATANNTVLTVQQDSKTAAPQVVASGDEMLVLAGSVLTDCACPTGQFNFRDMPLEIDLAMKDIAVKGSLCGDALEKCQFLKIPFLDESGNVMSDSSPWWTPEQADMYKDLERRKHYEKLLNSNFGIVPNLRARGIKFSPASTTEITIQDMRDLKSQLDLAGIAGREYAIFAGRVIFSQLQVLAAAAGVTQRLTFTDQPMSNCKWINMEYCGFKVEGLTLHVYDECSFSSGKELGSIGMNFPASAIFVPLGDRPQDATRSVSPLGRNGYSNNKMFETVYFQSIQGRRYDMYTDSNGFLNGPNGRNTFGTGCKTHEWSAETRFLLETYCMNSWMYIGLN